MYSKCSRTALLGVVSMMALAISGCGGNTGQGSADAAAHSPAASSEAQRPARSLTGDQALQALLSVEDLPTGWATGEEDLSPAVKNSDYAFEGVRGDAACNRFLADASADARPTVDVERDLENSASGYKINASINVYADTQDAQQAVARSRQLGHTCPKVTLRSETEGPYPGAYAAISAPKVRHADETAGDRVTVNGNRFDFIHVRVGPNIAQLAFVGEAGDDAQLVNSLTEKAAAKLADAGG